MIKVLIYDSGREFTGRVLSLSSDGHGISEVCAAASCMMQTLAAYLLNVQQDMPKSLFVDVRTQEGRFALDAIVQNDEDQEVQFILDIAADIVTLGFMQLTQEAKYKDQLEVRILPDMGKKKSITYWINTVRLWRTANGFDLNVMQPPSLIRA